MSTDQLTFDSYLAWSYPEGVLMEQREEGRQAWNSVLDAAARAAKESCDTHLKFGEYELAAVAKYVADRLKEIKSPDEPTLHSPGTKQSNR